MKTPRTFHWVALACLNACSCGDAEAPGEPDAAGGSGGASGSTGGSTSVGGTGAAAGGSGGVSATGGGTGDAQADADTPGWQPADWSPGACAVLVASDLALALPAETWLPCIGSSAGCTYLDTAKIPGGGNGDPNQKMGPAQVAQSNGELYLGLNLSFAVDDNVGALYQVGVGPVAAWRAKRTNCGLSGLFLDGGVFTVIAGGQAGPTGGWGWRVMLGAVTDPKALSGPFDLDKALFGGKLQGFIGMRASNSVVALNAAFPSEVFAGFGSPPASFGKLTQASGVTRQQAVHVKDANVLLERDPHQPEKSNIALSVSGAEAVTLYQNNAAFVSQSRSDGVDIVWQERTTAGTVEGVDHARITPEDPDQRAPRVGSSWSLVLRPSPPERSMRASVVVSSIRDLARTYGHFRPGTGDSIGRESLRTPRLAHL